MKKINTYVISDAPPETLRVSAMIGEQLNRLRYFSVTVAAYETLAAAWGKTHECDVIASITWLTNSHKKYSKYRKKIERFRDLPLHLAFACAALFGFAGALSLVNSVDSNSSYGWLLNPVTIGSYVAAIMFYISSFLFGRYVIEWVNKTEQMMITYDVTEEAVKAFLNHLQAFIHFWPVPQEEMSALKDIVTADIRQKALDLIKREHDLNPRGNQLRLVRYTIIERVNLVREFGMSNGDLKPYFDWARKEWERLASACLVGTDRSK